MAAEGKAPTLAEEYSLPPQEVPAEKAAEKPDIAAEAEAVPASNDEAPPADETPAAVEDKSGTPVQDDVDKSEAEETNTATEETTETAAEETTETAEEEEAEEKPEIKIETAPADFRFPTTNQSRHCFTRYVEYHRCVAAKGDDAPECDKFQKYYRSLCPGEWVDRWNEQRENGTFPGPL